jgi:hypothetical protein
MKKIGKVQAFLSFRQKGSLSVGGNSRNQHPCIKGADQFFLFFGEKPGKGLAGIPKASRIVFII